MVRGRGFGAGNAPVCWSRMGGRAIANAQMLARRKSRDGLSAMPCLVAMYASVPIQETGVHQPAAHFASLPGLTHFQRRKLLLSKTDDVTRSCWASTILETCIRVHHPIGFAAVGRERQVQQSCMYFSPPYRILPLHRTVISHYIQV